MLRRYLHLVNLPEADETEAVLVKRGHGDDGQKRQAWAWRRSQGDGQVMDHGNARRRTKTLDNQKTLANWPNVLRNFFQQ